VYVSAKGGSALGGETFERKYKQCIGIKTNNEAEYQALIFGLNKLKQALGKDKSKNYAIECLLDSELVVKQMNHQYKIKEKHIQNFFIEIWNLMLDFGQVTFRHIPREQNKIADALVNEALDEEAKQSVLL
jgi:ribonuclease HI